jgi:hypothetical protein
MQLAYRYGVGGRAPVCLEQHRRWWKDGRGSALGRVSVVGNVCLTRQAYI